MQSTRGRARVGAATGDGPFATFHRAEHDRQVRRAFLLVGSSEVANDVVHDALRALPFNQRAAVVLRFYGRLTVAEIAEALGCPPGSVGPWIHRALQTLPRTLS